MQTQFNLLQNPSVVPASLRHFDLFVSLRVSLHLQTEVVYVRRFVAFPEHHPMVLDYRNPLVVFVFGCLPDRQWRPQVLPTIHEHLFQEGDAFSLHPIKQMHVIKMNLASQK